MIAYGNAVEAELAGEAHLLAVLGQALRHRLAGAVLGANKKCQLHIDTVREAAGRGVRPAGRELIGRD